MKSLATLPHHGIADSVGTVLVGPERADSNLDNRRDGSVSVRARSG